jgi:hypothetical protein
MSTPEPPPALYPLHGQAITDALARAIPGLRWQWRAYSEILAFAGAGADEVPIARLSMWLGYWAVCVGREELPLDRRDRDSMDTLTLAARQALEAHHDQMLARAATLRAALDITAPADPAQEVSSCG